MLRHTKASDIGASRYVGHDEANARIKFARMPFDLGDDPARLRPASGALRRPPLAAPSTWPAPDPFAAARTGIDVSFNGTSTPA
jgi:hypothetical protein